jgi:DNA-binding transcriptional regulator YiaG
MSPERIARLLSDVVSWCKKNRYTQVELAQALGVSPQLVTEWKKGRAQPTGEQALHMQELIKTKPKRSA